jgi:hypothetical protein
VNLDVPEGKLPSTKAVDKAAKLLKGNQKAAREMHPLFARGLDTMLDMKVCVSVCVCVCVCVCLSLDL